MAYSYPASGTRFGDRDTAPLGSSTREIRGVHWDPEFDAITAEFVLVNNAIGALPGEYLPINNPAFTGTMTGGIIDGGTF